MTNKRSDVSDPSSSKKYPFGAEHYQLYDEIGRGGSATVHPALCVPLHEVVAIKILDLQHSNLDQIGRESHIMSLVDSDNVLNSHCAFTHLDTDTLWVVMPYMDAGSCLHVLQSAYPKGFTNEVYIATILRQALKGLVYLHDQGLIHRDVKAGNILLDSRTNSIKLGDLGVSAYLFDSCDRIHNKTTFTGTPCWMAPEVMENNSSHGYDCKADIWSFGITALELAHGHAPFSDYPPLKVLCMTLQSPPPSLHNDKDRKFSKSFKDMIAKCLVKDPSKRPSAQKLLKHSFFKTAKSSEYVVQKLMQALPHPTLVERVKTLKTKEAHMLAQKKTSDVKKEEISQEEYKRGISAWNFNMDFIKEQVSLKADLESKDNQASSSSSSSSSSPPEYVTQVANNKQQIQLGEACSRLLQAKHVTDQQNVPLL